MFFRIFICTILISCLACQSTQRQVEPAFYHWKTTLDLTESEQKILDTLAVKKIYAKFFDVDWQNNTPAPTAEIIVNPTTIPAGTSIIPTVYITNQTLINIPQAELSTLAKNIVTKIKSLAVQMIDYQLFEVQFDCDWTLTTKDKYFQLLKDIKKEFFSEVQLSATIRLHQIKYKNKTGIPPVERGVLMFYNTGDLKKWTTENSILELAEAGKYIADLENYDLLLDIALPIFNWGVVYREERLFKLINGLNREALNDTIRFIKINPQRYEVIKSTYLGGHFLYKNDKIRLEKIDGETLIAATKLIAPRMNNDDFQVLFYHLDSTTIVQHPAAELYELKETFIDN